MSIIGGTWRGSRAAFGALRPGVREGRDPVVVAEVVLDPLLARAGGVVRFDSLARFPSVDRDLSVLADAAVAAGGIVEKVQGAAGELLCLVEVKDRYDRPPVPEGKVSLMISLRYQHPSRTLTSDEVQDFSPHPVSVMIRWNAVSVTK